MKINLLNYALEYEKIGWFVLPADPVKKKPLVKWAYRREQRPKQDEIRGWWKKFPDARIAIATGAYSGFDAVDVDGPEALEKLSAICGGVPGTIYQTTGRVEGGRHFLFKHNGRGLRPYQDGALDLRTTDSIIIVAPSPHKSGKEYTWGHINPLEDGLDDLADWPPELVEYFRSISGSCPHKNGPCKPVTVAPVPRGERHQALVRSVGKWLNEGLGDETILLAARGWWEALPDKEGFSIAELEEQTQDLIARYRKPQPPAEGGKAEKEKQADALIRIGKTAELFKAPDGTLWARFETNGHFEAWQIRAKGSGFRRWLVNRFYIETESAPSATAVQAAVEVLEAEAQFGGARKTREVFTRVGEYCGGIYLDLGDDEWRAVKISTDGWEVVTNLPVCFRRASGMLPLPEPARGGTLRILDDFLNLGDEQDRQLILSWLIYTLNPSGPFPLLGFISEQGSGKSTTAKLLRQVIDPNQAPIRALPKSLEDLAVAAQHSWILNFDNLSYIPDSFSDALCRMATGGGFATRTLYTNDQETVFYAKRPAILNGISEFASRPDLLERTLIINLPAIPAEKRQPENVIIEMFEKARPAILGAVLDAVVLTLRNLSNVKITECPRMADFGQWAAAGAAAIGAEPGEVVSLILEKQNEALLSELDAPIPQAIFELLEARAGQVEMLLSELLLKLDEIVGPDAAKKKGWPTNPRGLQSALTRLTPVLRVAGVKVESLKKTRRGRKVLISKCTGGPSHAPVDHHTKNIGNYTQNAKNTPVGDDCDGRFPYNSLPLREEREEGGTERKGDAQEEKGRKTPSPPVHRHTLDLFGGEL